MVTLKQLGNASVSSCGTLVTGRAAQGCRLALLAILAAARGRPVPRDKIIALLWPESPTDRARHQLSDTLYILRTGLGDDVILASGDDLMLNTDVVASDVAEFGQLIDADEWERAVHLVEGPLLDGFHLPDSVEFERWLDAERMRIDGHYARALEYLAEHCEKAGDFPGAVRWWRRLVAHDPQSGRIAVRLMRSLEASGDRGAALRHARGHAELLKQEFDAQPDTEVAAYAERLRVAPPALPAAPPAANNAISTSEPVGVADTQIEQGAAKQRTFVPILATVLVIASVVGAVYGITGGRPAGAETEHSVAVLPFLNMSAESGADYFSDGLTEQIISVLSRIPGLRVAARTSSFALRDEKLDIRTVADTLNVTAVLEGSVRREGNRLRVTAQLIDAATGYHLWSRDYDREMRQIVEVQDEIARDIAHALELRLPESIAQPASEHAPDPQAYDLYLRALYLRDTFSPDALNQAKRYLDRAVELDPAFARAYMLKATVLGPATFWRYVPLESGVAEMRVAITRALELDPQLGEAHGALGMLKLFYDWDFPGAERALRRALQLNPNDHHAWHMLGNYYSAMGRPKDEVTARARAVDIDPLNVRMGLTLGDAYSKAGRNSEAFAQLARSTKFAPAHPMLLGDGPVLPFGPVRIYLRQGRRQEAVGELLRIASLRGASEDELKALRTAFERGMPSFWRAWLMFDVRHSSTEFTPDPVRMAIFHALAGDNDQALASLERAYAERNPALIYVPTEPMFAAVRDHPRFRRIVRGMNFPGS